MAASQVSLWEEEKEEALLGNMLGVTEELPEPVLSEETEDAEALPVGDRD